MSAANALVGRLERLATRASEYLPSQLAGELADTLRRLVDAKLVELAHVEDVVAEVYETVEETIDDHVSRRVTLKNSRMLDESKAWQDEVAKARSRVVGGAALGDFNAAVYALGSLTLGNIRADEPAEDKSDQADGVKSGRAAGIEAVQEVDEAPARRFFEALADGFDSCIGGRL